MEGKKHWSFMLNWILLGLVMLIPGLLKLFVMGPAAVTGMLAGIGFPAAAFFAWVLIILEILTGALIFARYKLQYVAWIPAIILVVAALTVHWGDWAGVLVHLALASNYLLLTAGCKKK